VEAHLSCDHAIADGSRVATSPLLNRRNDMTASPNPVISSDKVEGTKVYNLAGEKLGSINDLMIDKLSGQVRYAVMEFGGFLGMGTDRYPLPWNVLKYNTDKDGYVVALEKSVLEKAPRYSDADVPPYTDEYNKRVDSYYGIGPL